MWQEKLLISIGTFLFVWMIFLFPKKETRRNGWVIRTVIPRLVKKGFIVGLCTGIVTFMILMVVQYIFKI
jgi:hypothetical protein